MLDPTTLAAYRAAQTAQARAQAVRDSLGSGTLSVELRDGALLVYSGTFSGPMTAGAEGSLSASAQLAGLVTTAGTPSAATWTCRIANGSGRYIEGSFGPGGRFTWSQGTLRVGDVVRLDVSIAAAGGALPAWVPEPGSIVDISLNSLIDLNPCPANNCVWSGTGGGPAEIFKVWCGGAWAAEYSTLGAFLYHGGGHNSYSGNEVYAFDLDTRRWAIHGTPSPYTETDADSNGEYPDGAPFPPHTYSGVAYMPPAWGGGTKGSYLRFGFAGAAVSQWIHRMDLATGSWSRFADLTALGGSSYRSVVRDDSREGWWIVPAQGNVLFVSKTGAVTSYGGAAYVNSGAENVACYVANRDLLVNFDRSSGGTQQIKYADASNLAAGWFSANGASLNAPVNYTRGFEYSSILDCIVSYHGEGGNVVKKLPIPTVLTDDWTWQDETLSGAASYLSGNPNGHWRRFVEVPAARCFMWAESANGPVQAFRMMGS